MANKMEHSSEEPQTEIYPPPPCEEPTGQTELPEEVSALDVFSMELLEYLVW